MHRSHAAHVREREQARERRVLPAPPAAAPGAAARAGARARTAARSRPSRGTGSRSGRSPARGRRWAPADVISSRTYSALVMSTSPAEASRPPPGRGARSPSPPRRSRRRSNVEPAAHPHRGALRGPAHLHVVHQALDDLQAAARRSSPRRSRQAPKSRTEICTGPPSWRASSSNSASPGPVRVLDRVGRRLAHGERDLEALLVARARRLEEAAERCGAAARAPRDRPAGAARAAGLGRLQPDGEHRHVVGRALARQGALEQLVADVAELPVGHRRPPWRAERAGRRARCRAARPGRRCRAPASSPAPAARRHPCTATGSAVPSGTERPSSRKRARDPGSITSGGGWPGAGQLQLAAVAVDRDAERGGHQVAAVLGRAAG